MVYEVPLGLEVKDVSTKIIAIYYYMLGIGVTHEFYTVKR